MATHEELSEVVRVDRPFRLIDAESYEHRYPPMGRTALPRGFYVVTWPDPDGQGRFDERARFRGPYASRAEAEAASAAKWSRTARTTGLAPRSRHGESSLA